MQVRTESIASPRHTVILCAILLAIAAAGWAALHSAGRTQAPGNSAALLLGAMVAELALLYYVWVGLHRRGASIRHLVFEGDSPASRALADIVLGLALFALLATVSGLIARWSGAGDVRLVKPLIGAAVAQPALWILLSLAAALSEELTFRGYLQRQFAAWTRNPLVAIAAQAALFGITHGYQGGMLMLRIALLGIIFGLTAWARRSTVPCIVAHFSLDVASGLGLFR